MVSIIIPTFNRSNLLLQTLQSIIALQSNFDLFEVLIVDNGSTDDTSDLIKNFISSNQKLSLSYFFEDNLGLLSARHRGLYESKFEILAFIDDDVILDPNWLNAIVKTVGLKTDFDLFTGPTLPKYQINPPSWLDYFFTRIEGRSECSWLSLQEFKEKEIEIDPLFVWGLNFIVRKSTLLKLGGFNPDNIPNFMQEFQGDGETGLALKAKMKNIRAYYCEEIKLHHFIPQERLSSEYFEKRAFYQGVANSFTELKNRSKVEITKRKVPLLKVVKRKIKKIIGIPKQNILPLEIISLKQKFSLKEQEGFKFHQEAYKNNLLVKKWVEKENYLDYKLPKNA